MKNTTNIYSGHDKGIAIMFSLIMLSVFFLIAFGFVSMATSHNSAAVAREPAQQAALAVNDTVLNEALFAIEKGLMNGQTPDYTKFTEMKFINASDTFSVTLNAWSTSSADQASLEDALALQIHTSDDFEPDTDTGDNPEWANVGWIAHNVDGVGAANDDKYCWMVIESSGVDPNYIGDSSYGNFTTVSGRPGDYIRETDISKIDSNFQLGAANPIYVDWTVATPVVWEDKKSLISGFSTALIETAISLFEPGTSAITLQEQIATSKFDLSRDCTSYTANQLHSDIPWLSNTNNNDSKRLACNITDYIDEDNEASKIDDIYGKERVPYINEAHFKITNNTVAGSTSAPQPIQLKVEVTPELVKILTVSGWGTPNGSTAEIQVTYDISANKPAPFNDVSLSKTDEILTVTQNLSTSLNEGYLKCNSASTTVDLSSTGSSTNTMTAVEVTVTLKEVKLTGDGTIIWDMANFTTPVTSATGTIAAGAGSAQFISFEAADCRNNHTNWAADGFSTSEAGSGSITVGSQQNTNYTATDGETGEPWEVSTAYMPEDGKIQYLSEVGMISRGKFGETINITDYNLNSPTAFVSGKYEHNNGDLAIETDNTFDGGDRAILDYVYVGNSGAKGTLDLPSYQQFGAINPNSTNRNAIKLLLTGVRPLVGPDATPGSEPDTTTINSLISNFPGIEQKASADAYFKVEHFHDIDGDTYHNRNPTRYEYAFSKKHANPILTLSDAQREALVIHTMNLASTKYSYFTILAAVELSTGTSNSIYAFVRRDNESGSYKILRKSTQ